MKKVIRLLFILITVMVSGVNAQDTRFSQYFNKPLVLNPALAGNGIEYIRVTAIYRNQWTGFGTPFTTQGLSVDKVVNRIGIGAVITRNGGGEGSIKTLNLSGNLAYHQPLGESKNNTLSIGLQVGVVNKSFDPNKLTFDNQYNPDQGYDPNQSSGEIFTTTSITRPDVNAGIFWQRGWLNKEIKFKPFLGVSYSHITRPVETFIVDETKVKIKQTIYGGAGIKVGKKSEIKPTIMNLSQGTFGETTFGTTYNYQLDSKNQVQLGAFHRVNDAVIAYAGYQMNQLFVGMSYDFNTGELSKTGKGTDAFEISLTYSPRPKKAKEPKEIKVPPTKPVVTNETISTVLVTSIPNVVEQEIAVRNLILPQNTTTTLAAVTEKEILPAQPATETKAAVKEQPFSLTKPIVAPITIETPKVIAPIDSDKDGINDADDRCPFIKGSRLTNGCPDSDNDGLIDMEDDCPLASGPKTNKGCPDPNVPSVKNNQELVKSFDHILFNTGSTKMTTDDIYDIVERAVDVLYADKKTTVMLSGHTDSEGKAEFNMNLSQARVEVVKAYLIKAGIEESRIQTVAYGETMPVRDNLFDENMKRNRRVELSILKIK
jgi:type IX secretion system PorP/SprF family membrane protein